MITSVVGIVARKLLAQLLRASPCKKGDRYEHIAMGFSRDTLARKALVKAYDTPEAVRTLRGALGATTPVLSLQNGVGNEELIAAEIGAHRTLAGTITISASRPRPGVVRQNTAVGGIGVAALDPGQDPSGWVQLFRRAGIPARPYRIFREMKWSKLLINLFTNATSAIVDLSPVAVVEDARLLEIERTALREVLAVMKGLGLRPVALPGYPVPALRAALVAPAWLVRPVLRRLVRRGRGETRTSLWHDLQRGRCENEVAVLNGAVAREAARIPPSSAGIPRRC